MQGLVFDIQRFSTNDGPGIRTTIFLKGCSLECSWCHNPESINTKPQLQVLLEKCIGCGKCFKNCNQHAHVIENGKRVFKKEKCIACGKCASECYSGALVLVGNSMSVKQVINEIKKDIEFYKNSKGGITISGGEPLLQSKFCKEILMECNKLNIHTAIDTAGNVPFDAFLDVIDYTDLFLYDIKMINSDKHKKYIGANNKLILENIQKIDEKNINIIVRIPIIPEINNGIEEIKETVNFLKKLKNVQKVELLSYHNLGSGKYEGLSMECKLKEIESPTKDEMDNLGQIFKENNIKIEIDGIKR